MPGITNGRMIAEFDLPLAFNGQIVNGLHFLRFDV